MNVSLNGIWKLTGLPEKDGVNPPHGVFPDIKEAQVRIDGQVPGNVQLDLYAAGLEPDPFFGDNYYRYIPYESWSWLYERSFALEKIPEGEEMMLRFDGIDTVADIFLNGSWIGRCEDMFVEHEWDVTNAVRTGENTLSVRIFSAMHYVREKEYPVGMIGTANRNQISYIRKAPHCFGWDIAPRMVTAGLWRDVSLYSRKKTRLTQTYFAVSAASEAAATLRWAFRFTSDAPDLEDFRITVDAVCGESGFSFQIKPNFSSMNGAYTVRSPKLWWPRGYGEASLYTVTTRLWQGDVPVDEKTETIGLRSVRLERDFTPGQQKFCFYVNETPIFCRGTNWVPMDAFHSRARERIPAAVKLIAESGCNIIRCWGGGIYEDSLLYDLCDREGILIWQDFAMGNTTYPQDGSIDGLLSDEIEKLLCRIRNHPCVCLYSSDNEIDQKNMAFDYPEYRVRYNRIAFELLPKLLQAHDPYRFYIRSSPEVPDGFHLENVPEQHTWGPRAWYKDPFYRDSSASFIGEAGYHGCPAPESIRRFIPAEDLWPMWKRSWEAHSTDDLRYTSSSGRNQLMERQVKLLFGTVPEDLETFAFLSQVSQAEAVKFFIERTRALKWQRTGIIWWNMIDCWPQISDAVVDYYYVKKLAYTWITHSQMPVLVFVGEASGWQYPLYITNDTRETAEVSYTITDADTEQIVAQGKRIVPAGEKIQAGGLSIMVSEKRCLLIGYTANGREYKNHYLTGLPPYDADVMQRWVRKIL
ncbi:MAG: hypothetical protein IJ480_05445 [Clostridia bacterium]|nr:hypothetical protein [Clostridia bacterium]